MSFLKILVYLQTGCLGGSLQWTAQWIHFKAHNATKDVSKLQNGSYQLHGRAYYFSMFDFSIRVYAKFLFSVNFVFRLLEEVYIEVFNERILTHTIRAQNVSKDTFCENAFKKQCISKLQQCLYQSHRLNLKTKRNHSCIEFSLKQKWSLIFWISIQ